MIAEKDTVYKTFPTPLINRLEKHFVLTETILLHWQEIVLNLLKEWVETFSNVDKQVENNHHTVVSVIVFFILVLKPRTHLLAFKTTHQLL